MWKKYVCLALLVLGVMLLSTSVAPAEVVKNKGPGDTIIESPNPTSLTLSGAGIGAGIGVAITILGAGIGFGRIGAAALESMARQPERATQIQAAMIIIAALLEGATFFALVICLLINNKATF